MKKEKEKKKKNRKKERNRAAVKLTAMILPNDRFVFKLKNERKKGVNVGLNIKQLL